MEDGYNSSPEFKPKRTASKKSQHAETSSAKKSSLTEKKTSIKEKKKTTNSNKKGFVQYPKPPKIERFEEKPKTRASSKEENNDDKKNEPITNSDDETVTENVKDLEIDHNKKKYSSRATPGQHKKTELNEETKTSPENSEDDESKDEESDDDKKIPVLSITKDEIAKTYINTDNKKTSIYGFPNETQAKDKQTEWHKKIYSKFFKVAKPLIKDKPSDSLYQNITAQVYNQTSNNPVVVNAEHEEPIHIDRKAYDNPIVLDQNCSKRSLIIALSKILSENKYMPNMVFQIGITKIALVKSSDDKRVRQIGNCMMVLPDITPPATPIIGYGEACERSLLYMLNDINNETKHHSGRENVLLQLIKKRLPSFSPFHYRNFNEYGKIKLPSDNAFIPQLNKKYLKSVDDRIHFLNGLMFLITVVEVIVRLYRDDQGKVFNYQGKHKNGIESDNIPVGIFQARSLALLTSGKITFKNFLGVSDYFINEDMPNQHAVYGAFTAKGTIDTLDIVFNKILKINSGYNKMICDEEELKEFKNEYTESSKDAYFIEGKSGIASNLKDCFGSGNESDESSSPYSSGEEESDTPIYKPK